MLKQYGDKALKESAARADDLENEGDHDGAAIWRLITDAVEQLANTTPAGRCTKRSVTDVILGFTPSFDFRPLSPKMGLLVYRFQKGDPVQIQNDPDDGAI